MSNYYNKKILKINTKKALGKKLS